MKVLAPIVLFTLGASALSIPESVARDVNHHDLEARIPKGGGGGGGKGGSGSSSSGSSSSGSSGKGGSGSTSSGSSSSSSSGKGAGSSSSSTGGRTTTGSGVTPRVGGFYGGGASVPYASGQRSASGISPVLLGAGTGLAFGSLWAHTSFYNYPYTHPFIFHNSTTNSDETKPVNCLCTVNEECSCDDNSNSTYVQSLIGNGSYSALNQSLVTVADVNGTSTIVINGTLPNGTTAAGGTESASSAPSIQSGGYLALVTLISAGVFLL